MILGVTGSIGSGKTTVAKLFSRHRYNRIDADAIGHQIIKKNSDAYKKLVNEFGNKILDKNRNIDRKKLGDIIFSDTHKLKKLNSVIHPIIVNQIKNQIEKIKEKCIDKTKIVIDAPLLLETGTKGLVDKIIVVKCDTKNIIKRNRRYPKEKIEKILNSQMPLEEKLKYADFIVDNSKDINYLKNYVDYIVEELQKT